MFRKLFVLSLLIGTAGSASAAVIECRGCTYQAMEDRVTSMGNGTYTIWNPINAEIHKFQVRCGIAPNRGDQGIQGNLATDGEVSQGSRCYAEEGDVLQGMIDTAANLSPLFMASFGTYSVDIEINANNWMFPGWTGGSSPTANDYVTNANYRSQLNDKLDDQGFAYASNTLLRVALEYIFAHADAALQFTNGIVVTATIHFDNGSKVKVQFKLNQPVAYVPGTARDDTGQLVPDSSAAPNAGSWTYYSSQIESRDRMVNTMSALGFVLAPRPPTFTTIVCTFQPGPNALTCTYPK